MRRPCDRDRDVPRWHTEDGGGSRCEAGRKGTGLRGERRQRQDGSRSGQLLAASLVFPLLHFFNARGYVPGVVCVLVRCSNLSTQRRRPEGDDGEVRDLSWFVEIEVGDARRSGANVFQFFLSLSATMRGGCVETPFRRLFASSPRGGEGELSQSSQRSQPNARASKLSEEVDGDEGDDPAGPGRGRGG